MSPEIRALKRILAIIGYAMIIGIFMGIAFMTLSVNQIAFILIGTGLYFCLRTLFSMYVAEEKAKDAQ